MACKCTSDWGHIPARSVSTSVTAVTAATAVSSSSFPLYKREMLGDSVYEDVGSGIRPTLMLAASKFFVVSVFPIPSFICGWLADSMLGLDPLLLSFSGDVL